MSSRKTAIGPSAKPGPERKEREFPEMNCRPVIGPALPPNLIRKDKEEEEESKEKGGRKTEEKSNFVIGPSLPGKVNDAHSSKRVVGPSRPSAAVLEAAAKLTEAQKALEEAEEEELAGSALIGPIPPAVAQEALDATEAERFAEVERILKPDLNSYEILGVGQQSSAAEMKKRYWKLSLLVHPDKCSHALAQKAFTQLNAAFKELQDPAKRSLVDAKVEQKEAKEEYEAELTRQKEAAEWRRLRGEALPGDNDILNGPSQPAQRGTWMTELPAERQARQATTNTFFSRKEVNSRGDTSEWTDTPLEKAKRAKQMYLEAYQGAMLEGPSAAQEYVKETELGVKAAIVDQYNESTRKLSMVEKHQAKMLENMKKKEKKRKKEKEGPTKEEEKWAKDHPWKPWDRDVDLSAGRKAMKMDDKKIVAEGLGSRFSSTSAGGRNFL